MEMITKYHTFRQYHRRKTDSWPEQHQRPYLGQINFYWINNLVIAIICSLLLLNSSVAAEATQVCIYNTNIGLILFSFLSFVYYYDYFDRMFSIHLQKKICF